MYWLARILRWLSDFLWPGDYDRDSASLAYKDYLESTDAASLNAAIESFQFAIDQYRKYKSPSLVPTLINYAIVVWKHYEDCGRTLDDLDKVIRLDTEAYESWSGEKDTKTYLLLLNALAGTYFEQYQMAFVPSSSKVDEKQKAFDGAVKYFTELKDNPAAGNQRSAIQIQLGILFRTRGELEQTLDRFEVGIQYMQDALREVTEAGDEVEAGGEDHKAKQGKEAALDDIKATCLLSLAESYEIRYVLVKDLRKIHDLTMAIDLNTKAKPLLEALDRPELPACLYNLARQHRLRWIQTSDESDFDTAKEMAEAARDDVDDDDPLKQDIERLVNVLGSESRQGTLDSVDMHAPSRQGTMYEGPDGIYIPKRRGTVIAMDIAQMLE